MSITLQTNNFVVTFETEDEVVKYMDKHIPEEK